MNKKLHAFNCGESSLVTRRLMKYLFPLILKGDNLRETNIAGDRDQHDVATTYLNLTGNLKCTSRREAGGVISYIAAA